MDWLVEHQVKGEMLNSRIWPCYSSFKISCFSAYPLLMLRVHPGETKEREKMVKILQYSNLSTDAQSKWLNTGYMNTKSDHFLDIHEVGKRHKSQTACKASLVCRLFLGHPGFALKLLSSAASCQQWTAPMLRRRQEIVSRRWERTKFIGPCTGASGMSTKMNSSAMQTVQLLPIYHSLSPHTCPVATHLPRNVYRVVRAFILFFL